MLNTMTRLMPRFWGEYNVEYLWFLITLRSGRPEIVSQSYDSREDAYEAHDEHRSEYNNLYVCETIFGDRDE